MARFSKAPASIPATSFRLEDALALIEASFRPATAIETVPIGAALSRILAVDSISEMNVPGTDQSAVDGYAFRHVDLEDSRKKPFRLVGTAAAGRPLDLVLGAGEAARILTGAPIPQGADTVAMQEHVERVGDEVTLPTIIERGANCRKAGEDIAAGERVLPAGRRLGPADIGLLASIGLAEAAVRAPLEVAVFSTGDELVNPGQSRAPGQRYDSNRPALVALLASMGCKPNDLGILPDRRDAIETALADAAARFGAILSSGGMSVGDEDHVRPAVQKLGALEFWDVEIKPGRPIAAGQVAGTPFFGLPGNPAAALVTFLMLVRPALLLLSGAALERPPRFQVKADFALRRKAGRREYLRCTLADASDGMPLARRPVRDGSAVLTAVANADGFLELHEDLTQVRPGMSLPFIPKSAFGLWR
ncbi:MAG TPA: gephyrin-like molybdotransferase Glp [Alphaproteobacteria bacterium]|nr:gephyrin-like molybdotransferase Glp [Alphaproteobacteria bacterium]